MYILICKYIFKFVININIVKVTFVQYYLDVVLVVGLIVVVIFLIEVAIVAIIFVKNYFE